MVTAWLNSPLFLSLEFRFLCSSCWTGYVRGWFLEALVYLLVTVIRVNKGSVWWATAQDDLGTCGFLSPWITMGWGEERKTIWACNRNTSLSLHEWLRNWIQERHKQVGGGLILGGWDLQRKLVVLVCSSQCACLISLYKGMVAVHSMEKVNHCISGRCYSESNTAQPELFHVWSVDLQCKSPEVCTIYVPCKHNHHIHLGLAGR